MISVTCPNCGVANSVYKKICKSCRYSTRDKIPNIDLWATVSLLIESPSRAFFNIIASEHKNFILLIISVTVFKLALTGSVIYSNIFIRPDFNFNFMLITIGIMSGELIFFSLVNYFIFQEKNVKIRLRDIFASLSYALTPFAISLFILTLMELIVFGDSVFAPNPSVFTIKPGFAWFFIVLESLIIIWSGILWFQAGKYFTKNLLFNILNLLFYIAFVFSGYGVYTWIINSPLFYGN